MFNLILDTARCTRSSEQPNRTIKMLLKLNPRKKDDADACELCRQPALEALPEDSENEHTDVCKRTLELGNQS